MEDTKPGKRRAVAIFKAALLGAAIADGSILLDLLTSVMWKHGYVSKFWYDWFSGFAVLQAIPCAIISAETGYQGALLNAYLVNGLLGAFLFGMAAAFWQFAVKTYEEQ